MGRTTQANKIKLTTSNVEENDIILQEISGQLYVNNHLVLTSNNIGDSSNITSIESDITTLQSDVSTLQGSSGGSSEGSTSSPFNQSSVSFDGTDDSLDVASTSDYAFGISGFSIGFWFNPVGTNNSSGFGVNIFDMRGGAVSIAKPSLWMSSIGSGSFLKYYAAGAYRTTFSGTINPGSWYHVLITNDGSNTKFYLNGNSTAVATGSDSTNYIAAGLRIGGYGGNNYYYNGLIDEFAIWNATLSGADANAICSGSDFVPNDLSEASSYDTDRTSNLIGWWRMGDGTEAGSGTTVFDMSTNSNNGTLTNGPTFSTTLPS